MASLLFFYGDLWPCHKNGHSYLKVTTKIISLLWFNYSAKATIVIYWLSPSMTDYVVLTAQSLHLSHTLLYTCNLVYCIHVHVYSSENKHPCLLVSVSVVLFSAFYLQVLSCWRPHSWWCSLASWPYCCEYNSAIIDDDSTVAHSFIFYVVW